jgi:periplasmic protein TonB
VKLLRNLTTFQLAMIVSVLVHAGLLTVRFANPQAFDRLFQDTPLEVILVNSHTQEAPEKAQAIAQANMAGGGNVERGRATSPLPSTAQARFGQLMEEEERRMEAMKTQQSRMLAQLRQQLARVPPTQSNPESTPEQQQQTQRRQALMKALAEIEQRVNDENARPRKRYISPATKEAVYAVYYDALRRSIEARGTENFPTVGGRRLYGELTMAITVSHDGEVIETEVIQGSGQTVLDSRAQAIVRSLKFERFNSDMRQRADQIVVVSHFRFTRDETLRTRVSGTGG